MAVVRTAMARCGTHAVDEAARELSVRLAGSTCAKLLGGGAQRWIVTRLTPAALAFSHPWTPNGLTR